ncbi:hypothetical protein KDW_51670 [Dictyobacter vulcani]|uniref:Hydrolase n=1 Tax=Dictyobacter vulcani TaxID=2607529 RepID=A0A5J4KSY6_9CHLR|nr:hydrolase [Dictyobacter vulcani]GER91005.1 hypothetical protein KDW_51670 [Dictyobacter vulcani]
MKYYQRWLLLVCVFLFVPANLVACANASSNGNMSGNGSQNGQYANSTATAGSKTGYRSANTPRRVLFDAAHAESSGNADWIISTSMPDPLKENMQPQREDDWTGGISAWGVALQQTNKYSLKTNTRPLSYQNDSNALDLSKFDVLVLPEPNKLFTSSEKKAILNFVHAGGGLFMIADHEGSDRNHDGYDSLSILNDLMNTGSSTNNAFGLQFDAIDINYDNPHTLANPADPLLRGSFGQAKGSIIRDGTTETLDPQANPAVHGVIYRTGVSAGSTHGAFVTRSMYGTGRIVAIGDSSAIDDGTCSYHKKCFDGWEDPAAQDNILVLNATEWLSGNSTNGSFNN